MMAPRRPPALAGLFAIGALLLFNMAGPVAQTNPRWPEDGDLYRVSGWSVSPAEIDASRPGLTLISHDYTSEDSSAARLVESTSAIAKAVYRAGAAVPYLGNGYSVTAVRADLVPARDGREAFVATRGDEMWLEIDSYGERRGQLGSGALAWTLTAFDSLLGRSNDYYLARIVVRLSNPTSAERAVALADALFPRFAAWYGTAA